MHSHLDSTVAQSPSIPLPRVERRVIWANVAGFGVRSPVTCNSLPPRRVLPSSGNLAI